MADNLPLNSFLLNVFEWKVWIVHPNLEMRPCGGNEAPMVVVLDKSSKSLLFYVGEDIEKFEEQVEDNQVGIEEAREQPSSKYILQPFHPHQFK